MQQEVGTLQIGSLIDGKYKILNKIGQGGMSVVYLAMNEKANKQWAIKEVRKDGIQNYEVVKQGLIAETDMLKKLSHPNLPSIIDVIDNEDSFLIVMDYIEGNSLSKALEEYGAQPQEYVIEWAKQLCDVLSYLHTREPAIIYRDMKPSNVMLKPDGNISLIDFGTAREFKNEKVEDTTCLGTRGYAAPEQFGGQGQTDARTDIYCLGATMYHLVTGHNPAVYPYEMKPIREWNESLSAGLEEIILKCTRQNPNERYQNCNELLFALENFEKQDVRTRKLQKIKMSVFAGTLVLSFLSGAMSLLAHSEEMDIRSRNYSSLVGKAYDESDIETSVALFKEAVQIDNTRSEAYSNLLLKFKRDNENPDINFLDKEEKRQLENLLNEEMNGESNLVAFQNNNPEKCAEFLLDYAQTLMYDSGIENGRNNLERDPDVTKAESYFNRLKEMIDSEAIREDLLDDLKYVDTYLEFLQDKQDAGRVGATSSINYATYFEALSTLLDAEGLTTDAFRKASFYWDILSIIDNNDILKGFRNAGISDDEIVEVLDGMETGMDDSFLDEIENTLFWQNGEDTRTLKEYLGDVRSKVSSGTDKSEDTKTKDSEKDNKK